jgi:thiol-disulfide isomerase/thioredoxin
VVLDQEWAAASLVDVSTGETFRIADHAGKVIILETMAIWCTNCRAQQRDVKTALGELPADSVSYIVLDVDPNEDGPSLAAYRDQQGFEGRYAIAGTAVARALAAEFGDQVLNPPSTPIVFIGTDGRVTLTEFGHKSPDEIVALARAHGA